MGMTFLVSVSVEEALERLNKRIDSVFSGWACEVYRLKTESNRQIVSTMYQREYLRTGHDHTVIQAVLDDLIGTTRVYFSDSSIVKRLDVDLGASRSFQGWMKKALDDVLLPEQPPQSPQDHFQEQ